MNSESMDVSVKEELARLQKWLNRHLVSLVLIYWHLDEKGNPKDKSLVAACSGFVSSFADRWFLVSAGHVLKELDALVAHRFVKVVDSFIVDSFGADAKYDDNIPFNYAESYRFSVYEDGLDFGLIGLTPNERRLMEANGVQPIRIENWIRQDIDRCDGFLVLGIPAELVNLEEREKPGIRIGAIVASAKRLHELPEGAEETKYERFIGEIHKKTDLESLEGISGGPILGFFQDGGMTHYWVVALQSHCLGTRYIFGCPMKLLGDMLLEEMRRVIAAEEVSDGS